MRKRSEFFKDVFYEKWQTPISRGQNVPLWGVLQTLTHVHFFFTIDSKKNCHVMTIDRIWPYRVIEEGYASCIDKYFRESTRQKKKIKRRSTGIFRTWKLWGASFVKEIDEGFALSNYKMVHDENQFSYLVVAQDEKIEFISTKPTWEVFHNTNAKKVMQNYLKKY